VGLCSELNLNDNPDDSFDDRADVLSVNRECWWTGGAGTSARSSGLLCNEVILRLAAEVLTDPLLQLDGGEQASRLNHGPSPVHPGRFDQQLASQC